MSSDKFDELVAKWKKRQNESTENADIDAKWSKLQEKINPKPPEVLETAEYKRRITANFVEDLARGKKAEQSFYERHANCITPLNGKGADFEINKTGELIEYKADYYDFEIYPNIIIEIGSSTGTVGGPWKAARDECAYFIYHFVTNDVIFCFNTKQLVKRLDKVKDSFKINSRLNRGYTTQYIKVPYQQLEDLNIELNEIHIHEKGKKKK